jgi:hypothetical protein
MGDVQVAFGILNHCFMQHPSYFLWCTLLFSTFIESLISFDSSLHKMFGHLLGLRPFDSLKGPLARKQTSLPITFNGIGLILTFTIAATTYLGSWAFVIWVIVVRFMVDQNLFLLKTLTRINNTFPFQQHLKAACDILPPPAHACFPPFEQFIKQQMVQLEDSISKCLHHHTLFNMLSNGISKTHRARILSCSGLGASA